MSYSVGIEFGSTRIKGVVVDDSFEAKAIGTYDWENKLVNNLWSYSKEDIIKGLQSCFANLCSNFKEKCNIPLVIDSIGISAMMHGYIVLDKNDNILVPFRTWRNTNTGEAADKLSKLFNFNIPMRWSIAHLYQAILNKEEHVRNISYITTLAGYVHYLLTGEKVLGIGDASGMFPIDPATGTYDAKMIEKFDALVKEYNFNWKILDILPKVKNAGEIAGKLTIKGAQLLDINGITKPGIPFCPPEGDAGTGMIATNSIAGSTGNVSAGTSVFAMVVLNNRLSKMYPEIDVVTTPHGKEVAMVHCNNCTNDINQWVNLFKEVLDTYNVQYDIGNLYSRLFNLALKGDDDVGNLTSFNYLSGEPISKCEKGKPIYITEPECNMNLANFMKDKLFSSLATLAIGMNILKKEGVKIEKMCGHGGFFKTKEPSGRYMSCAVNAPIYIMDNAGEGGAWGIALLARYILKNDISLEEYLNIIFAKASCSIVKSKPQDRKSFKVYLKRYMKYIKVERSAGKVIC